MPGLPGRRQFFKQKSLRCDRDEKFSVGEKSSILHNEGEKEREGGRQFHMRDLPPAQSTIRGSR